MNFTKKIKIRDPHKDAKDIYKALLLTPRGITLFSGSSVRGVCYILDSERVYYSRKTSKQFTHTVLVEEGTIEISLHLRAKENQWFDSNSWKTAIESLREKLMMQNKWRIAKYINSKNLSDESLKNFIEEEFPKEAFLLNAREYFVLNGEDKKSAKASKTPASMFHLFKNCLDCISAQMQTSGFAAGGLR